jgi:23S rRNA (guanine2535-N1)-methyltransferase
VAAVKYRFATHRENHEDLSSGRVLYGRPGATAFPVRLASEIFQRCAERLKERGAAPPYSLYDPCCGGGYLLTVLGFLHPGCLLRIVASDIDPAAVERAQRNLSLLTAAGMERRLGALRMMAEQYGKPSHPAAIESGLRLQVGLTHAPERILTDCFTFDITGEEPLPEAVRPVDLVIADLPYGWTAAWRGGGGGGGGEGKAPEKGEEGRWCGGTPPPPPPHRERSWRRYGRCCRPRPWRRSWRAKSRW